MPHINLGEVHLPVFTLHIYTPAQCTVTGFPTVLDSSAARNLSTWESFFFWGTCLSGRITATVTKCVHFLMTRNS